MPQSVLSIHQRALLKLLQNQTVSRCTAHRRTDFKYRRGAFSLSVDHHELDREQRVILNQESRTKGDDFDVVDQLDLTQQAVRNLIQLWSQRVDSFTFAVDRDNLKPLPRGVFKDDTQRVVCRCSANMLRVRIGSGLNMHIHHQSHLSQCLPVFEPPR